MKNIWQFLINNNGLYNVKLISMLLLFFIGGKAYGNKKEIPLEVLNIIKAKCWSLPNESLFLNENSDGEKPYMCVIDFNMDNRNDYALLVVNNNNNKLELVAFILKEIGYDVVEIKEFHAIEDYLSNDVQLLDITISVLTPSFINTNYYYKEREQLESFYFSNNVLVIDFYSEIEYHFYLVDNKFEEKFNGKD